MNGWAQIKPVLLFKLIPAEMKLRETDRILQKLFDQTQKSQCFLISAGALVWERQTASVGQHSMSFKRKRSADQHISATCSSTQKSMISESEYASGSPREKSAYPEE